MKTVIIGRAGTGKTYTLMKKLEELDPRRTIYISFTRSAIHEARKRAREKFGLEDKEIKYFRTIHSICSRLLNIKKEDILSEGEIKEFFKNNYGVIYKNQMELRDLLEKDNEFNIQFDERLPDGNKLIFLIEHIQHTTKKSIADMDDLELKLKIFDFIDTCGKFDSLYLQFTENIIKVIRDFVRFKGKKLYYSDILLEFIKNPTIPEEIEYLIVDE
ncbi:MAG: UvrD-helicase domain-containing protein, partial [candidate division WOR-3 bacterium]